MRGGTAILRLSLCPSVSLAAPFTSVYQPFSPSGDSQEEERGGGRAGLWEDLPSESSRLCSEEHSGTFHGVTPLPCQKREGFRGSLP